MYLEHRLFIFIYLSLTGGTPATFWYQLPLAQELAAHVHSTLHPLRSVWKVGDMNTKGIIKGCIPGYLLLGELVG